MDGKQARRQFLQSLHSTYPNAVNHLVSQVADFVFVPERTLHRILPGQVDNKQGFFLNFRAFYRLPRDYDKLLDDLGYPMSGSTVEQLHQIFKSSSKKHKYHFILKSDLLLLKEFTTSLPRKSDTQLRVEALCEVDFAQISRASIVGDCFTRVDQKALERLCRNEPSASFSPQSPQSPLFTALTSPLSPPFTALPSPPPTKSFAISALIPSPQSPHSPPIAHSDYRSLFPAISPLDSVDLALQPCSYATTSALSPSPSIAIPSPIRSTCLPQAPWQTALSPMTSWFPSTSPLVLSTQKPTFNAPSYNLTLYSTLFPSAGLVSSVYHSAPPSAKSRALSERDTTLQLEAQAMEQLPIVVLDLDHTLGDFDWLIRVVGRMGRADFSSRVVAHFEKHNGQPGETIFADLIKHFIESNLSLFIRPDTPAILAYLKEMHRNGLIDKICIFTMGSPSLGEQKKALGGSPQDLIVKALATSYRMDLKLYWAASEDPTSSSTTRVKNLERVMNNGENMTPVLVIDDVGFAAYRCPKGCKVQGYAIDPYFIDVPSVAQQKLIIERFLCSGYHNQLTPDKVSRLKLCKDLRAAVAQRSQDLEQLRQKVRARTSEVSSGMKASELKASDLKAKSTKSNSKSPEKLGAKRKSISQSAVNPSALQLDSILSASQGFPAAELIPWLFSHLFSGK